MGGRIKYAVSSYSWIAMLNYWEAKHKFDRLLHLKYMCDEALELRQSLTNSSIVTVTFSAMSLEAFFNDYAATNLGDSFYYDNFEMLRPMGKFQLIAKFILNAEVAKGTMLYNLVDSLFRERNFHVHSKSKDASGIGMTEDEYKEFMDFATTDEGIEFLSQEIENDLETPKMILGSAFDALRALYEVGKFFDEHDHEKLALVKLLSAGMYCAANSDEIARVQEVQKLLGVPVIS